MRYRKRQSSIIWTAAMAAGIGLALCLGAGAAAGVENVDPDADRILRSMSEFLGGLPAFSMNVDIDNEIVNTDGQKLQLSAFSEIVIERPAKFHVRRRGLFADAEFIFDGRTLTLYGRKQNVYAQFESPGSIDDAIRTFEIETGLDAPGADLLFADPYENLASRLVSGTYLGTGYVDGVACHHLAFRQAKVDWQLWVTTGEEPLPMKYVITSKWVAGAPQYAVRLRDWNTKLRIDSEKFAFSVPAGARKLEKIPVNETGELMISKEGQ
jgi:hypothetical protein